MSEFPLIRYGFNGDIGEIAQYIPHAKKLVRLMKNCHLSVRTQQVGDAKIYARWISGRIYWVIITVSTGSHGFCFYPKTDTHPYGVYGGTHPFSYPIVFPHTIGSSDKVFLGVVEKSTPKKDFNGKPRLIQSGNQFFFNKDDVYSWWFSSRGDGPVILYDRNSAKTIISGGTSHFSRWEPSYSPFANANVFMMFLEYMNGNSVSQLTGYIASYVPKVIYKNKSVFISINLTESQIICGFWIGKKDIGNIYLVAIADITNGQLSIYVIPYINRIPFSAIQLLPDGTRVILNPEQAPTGDIPFANRFLYPVRFKGDGSELSFIDFNGKYTRIYTYSISYSNDHGITLSLIDTINYTPGTQTISSDNNSYLNGGVVSSYDSLENTLFKLDATLKFDQRVQYPLPGEFVGVYQDSYSYAYTNYPIGLNYDKDGTLHIAKLSESYSKISGNKYEINVSSGSLDSSSTTIDGVTTTTVSYSTTNNQEYQSGVDWTRHLSIQIDDGQSWDIDNFSVSSKNIQTASENCSGSYVLSGTTLTSYNHHYVKNYESKVGQFYNTSTYSANDCLLLYLDSVKDIKLVSTLSRKATYTYQHVISNCDITITLSSYGVNNKDKSGSLYIDSSLGANEDDRIINKLYVAGDDLLNDSVIGNHFIARSHSTNTIDAATETIPIYYGNVSDIYQVTGDDIYTFNTDYIESFIGGSGSTTSTVDYYPNPHEIWLQKSQPSFHQREWSVTFDQRKEDQYGIIPIVYSLHILSFIENTQTFTGLDNPINKVYTGSNIDGFMEAIEISDSTLTLQPIGLY